MISRRKLIQTLVFAAAGAITHRSLAASGKTVLVIGAGISGLAAAVDLRLAGFSVVVLEGRDRIGGRIFTDHSLGVPLDLGASWIHGINGNPIHALCQKWNIKTVPTSDESDLRYDTDGEEINDRRDHRLDADYAAMQKAIAEAQKDAKTDRPLGDFIAEYISTKQFPAQREKDLDLDITTEIEQEYAADISDMSFLWYEQDTPYPGPDVVFPGGYKQLVDKVSEGLDIRTGEIVTEIQQDEDKVRVISSGGTFTADYALVTLPVGVLKEGTVKFTPPLSDAKSRSIFRLHMSVYNKCCLKFGSVFWNDGYDWLDYINGLHGEWSEWLNLSHIMGAPVLVGYNGASAGEALEALSDEEIVASAMKVLRTIYNNAPDPVGFRITRWKQDPFAHGSYSHLPVGASPDDYVALGKREGRLYFAGEATSTTNPATVHGAWESGRRAAGEIVKEK